MFQSAGKVKSPKTQSSEVWYDSQITPYVCDDRPGSQQQILAPGLMWCPEIDILPTATRPLTGLESYAGGRGGIFPHAKIALESMPTLDKIPRINMTTGCCTKINYVQRKAGRKAEFHHKFAAVVVEVLPSGQHWARHLNARADGSFCDLNLQVKKGVVTPAPRPLAISWGDVHASEIDKKVETACWGVGGLVDSLYPRHQFFHDVFSFRSASHHDVGRFSTTSLKRHFRAHCVEGEVRITADFFRKSARPGVKSIAVCSNHDRHPELWLDSCDFRSDPDNAKIFLRAQLARLDARNSNWRFLPWAMKSQKIEDVHFLGIDQSMILKNVEYGLHGDLGADGSRGSTRGLARLGAKVTKGHDHRATICDSVYSAGVCQLQMAYAKGPSSWSISHVLQYANGKRVILTLSDYRPYAALYRFE